MSFLLLFKWIGVLLVLVVNKVRNDFEKVKISVIVPVYNTKEYLPQCIESIQNQTYTNVEIVLVDDGSSDGSGELCDDYMKNDPRIIAIHKKNSGQLSARKEGARKATGDYIMCVDADDWIDEDRIRRVVEKICMHYPDIVYINGFIREYLENSRLSINHLDEKLFDADMIKHDFMKLLASKDAFLDRKIFLAHWLVCVKREVYVESVDYVDDRIRRSEDQVAVLSCVLNSKSLYLFNSPSYHYRQDREGAIGARGTTWDEQHAELYFRELCKIEKCMKDLSPEVEEVVTQFSYQNLFLTNYRKLYCFYKAYLFPFFEVKNGSKIIVYGAGNVGIEMITAVEMDDRFDLISWVDRKPKMVARSKIVVDGIEEIYKREFDYIVISILDPSIASKIKEELVCNGISNEKIKTFQSIMMKRSDLIEMFGKR